MFAGTGEGAIGLMHSIGLNALPFDEMLQAAVGASGVGRRKEYRLLTLLDSAVELDHHAYSDYNSPNLAERVKLLTGLLGMSTAVN